MRMLGGLSERISLTVKRFPFGISAPQRGSSTLQLASLLEQFHRATRGANKLVLGGEADDLTSRWKPGSWSATECLDHLARTTLSFLPAISRAVATAPELTTNRLLRTGTIASLLIRNLEPPYRLRYKVIPQLAPQEKDFAAAWSSFENSQSQISEAVQSAAGLAIDKVNVPCPLCAHVTYNAYGAFRMLAAHQRRHLWQMQQILAGFDGRRAQKAAV
ncbi:MAG: DinB family protein [Candidatus Sulfotelmatobacter sp.]